MHDCVYVHEWQFQVSEEVIKNRAITTTAVGRGGRSRDEIML